MENKKKTKILYLITKSNWGGAQRYVYDLATTLDKNKYDCVVALGGAEVPNGTSAPVTSEASSGQPETYVEAGQGGVVLKDMLDSSGIRTILIPGLQRDFSLKKELLASFAIANIIRKEDPDIFHVNSSKAGGIGTFLGRILFVPRVIFTAHGWAFNEERPYWQRFIIKFFHWLTVIFSHHTIAVSHELKNQLKWPGAQRKMTVVNPGRTIVDMKGKVEARNQLAGFVPQLENHKNDFWLGTIAELHPIKRLDLAIESMSKLVRANPTLRYVIIGSGELRTKLENKIDSLQLNDHVFLTGAITEAGRLLSAFDMFALPSRSESYGYVLLEAGAAELPVVASNVGGIPDIITHGESGILIEAENSSALTEAIQKLINNEVERKELGAKLKLRANKLSVTAMTKTTETIYEDNISRT